VRLYTPLDLRNIKDIYVRSAFRRLDQWLRDLAGNQSPSNPQSSIIQIVHDNTVPPKPIVRRVLAMDDFTQQVGDTPPVAQLAQRHFDGFPWVMTAPSGANAHLRDARTAGDTTFPNTGLLVFDVGTVSGSQGGIFSSQDISADGLGLFEAPRDATVYHFGLSVPAATEMFCNWGTAFPIAGNDFTADYACDLIFYKSGVHDFNFAGNTGATFHGFGDKRDFVALRISTGTSGSPDVYWLCSASTFISASNTGPSIIHTSLSFNASTSPTNVDITATVYITGVTPQVVTRARFDVAGANMRIANRSMYAATTGSKMYFDYVISDRPLPPGVV
jgi:hypothetical protein